MAICISICNMYAFNLAILFLGAIITMLVSAFPCVHHWPKPLHILFHLIQNSRMKWYYLHFWAQVIEVKWLKQGCTDNKKQSQNSAFKVFPTISYCAQKCLVVSWIYSKKKTWQARKDVHPRMFFINICPQKLKYEMKYQ